MSNKIVAILNTLDKVTRFKTIVMLLNFEAELIIGAEQNGYTYGGVIFEAQKDFNVIFNDVVTFISAINPKSCTFKLYMMKLDKQIYIMTEDVACLKTAIYSNAYNGCRFERV